MVGWLKSDRCHFEHLYGFFATSALNKSDGDHGSRVGCV